MKLFIIVIFTFFFSISAFADTTARITSTLSFGQIDEIQSSYGLNGDPNTIVDILGAIIVMEGDTLLISDPSYNNYRGAVYVYIYNETTALYEKVSRITASNGAIGDKFGQALIIDDGLIIIGAPYADNGGDDRGLIYLLRKPDTGWRDIVCDNYLSSPSENNNDFFGKSIAVNSHILVVGAPGDNGYLGAAFVYDYDRVTPQLTYKGKLTPSDTIAGSSQDNSDMFGAGMAIDNDTIVIGSPNYWDGQWGVGQAYVYVKPASGWRSATENARLSPSSYSGVPFLGKNIAIEGDTIALSSSFLSHGLYIYEKPSGGWENSNENTFINDIVGKVALSGDTIIAGESRHFNGDKGIAKVYKKISGHWHEHKTISPNNVLSTDYLSRTIIKNGKNILIGVNSYSDGKVFVFGDILTENSIENKKDIMYIRDNSDDYDPYHYSLLEGEDADFFTFGNGYGYLKFKNSPDFETPLSANSNNIYTARILLSDQGGPLKAYHIAIKVSDIIDEGTPQKSMSFNELTKLKASNPDKNSKYGYSVAIDGNTAVVGAYDEGGYNIGLVYVYEKNTLTNKFEQKATLCSTYESLNEHLGISVAIKNDIIVVGADKYLRKIHNDNYIETGAALVYVKPEEGWKNTEETYVLYASDGAPHDLFGKSVAISNDTIVVGAPKNDNVAINAGAVYIFDIDTLNLHEYHDYSRNKYSSTKFTSWVGAEDDQYGESVAVGEDIILVGVPYLDTYNDTDIGSVYLYKKPLQGWVTVNQHSTYLDPDTHDGDMFGYRVAIANDVIAASSVRDDNGNGSVYLFKKPIYSWNNYWLSVPSSAKLTASDAHSTFFFGSSIAMNTHTIVIGAQNADNENGAVYLFDKPTSGWENAHENKKLINSNREEGNAFGCSVAMSGKTIIAGSYGENSSTGAAIIFHTDNDNDGITNDVDTDDDNDGVLDINDAFPNDASESIDTDHDGIGNNADLDDDNDGIEDTVEITHGLDPLDSSDAQADLDNDGFSNAIEIVAGSDIRDASSKPIWVPIVMGDIMIFIPHY